MAKDLEQVIALAGLKTRKIYAIGKDKAECMRKLQNIYPGKLDEKTRKRVGKTTGIEIYIPNERRSTRCNL